MISLDTDGDCRLLVPVLLEAGINVTCPLEVQAGMDPVALRREYGRDLRLWGGIDKRVLARTTKDIDRELMAKIPPLVADGGYIPTLDHCAPPDISYENWVYYLDRKMKLLERGC